MDTGRHVYGKYVPIFETPIKTCAYRNESCKISGFSLENVSKILGWYGEMFLKCCNWSGAKGVDLVKSFSMSDCSQDLASIQPSTSCVWKIYLKGRAGVKVT